MPGTVLAANYDTGGQGSNTTSYWESLDGAGFPQAITVNLSSVQTIGPITLYLPPLSDWHTRAPESGAVCFIVNGGWFAQSAEILTCT